MDRQCPCSMSVTRLCMLSQLSIGNSLFYFDDSIYILQLLPSAFKLLTLSHTATQDLPNCQEYSLAEAAQICSHSTGDEQSLRRGDETSPLLQCYSQTHATSKT